METSRFNSMEGWYAGTWTLVGVCLGGLVGFLIGQPPIGTVIGLGMGVVLDGWLHQRSEKEDKP